MTGPEYGRETRYVSFLSRLRELVATKSRQLQRVLTRWGILHDITRSSGTERGAEVFPWLEHTTIAAAVLGAAFAGGFGRAFHLGATGLIFAVLVGVIAGAFAGICLALTWAMPSRPHPDAPPDESRDLWDQWLDGDPSVIVSDAAPTPALEVVALEDTIAFARRARVRPRVISPHSGESLPLDDQIGPFLTTDIPGAIEIRGGPGSGKTTALRHLASIIPPYLRVSFLDEPEPHTVEEARTRGWVVYTADTTSASPPPHHPLTPVTRLSLAAWGVDELIEYLLATDSRRRRSVVASLLAAGASAVPVGVGTSPELWRIVLDRMIADESVPGPRHALRHELEVLLPDRDDRQLVNADCYAATVIHDGDTVHHIACLRRHDPNEQLFRLIRHRPVQLLLAADHLAHVVNHGAEYDALTIPLPRDLVVEAASRIAEDSETVFRLRALITHSDRRIHPMVASITHALQIGWTPELPIPRLAGAYLARASWDQINLRGADLQGADLASANLFRSRLDQADLENARLSGAQMALCSLKGADLDGADLSRAVLTAIRAEDASFQAARAIGANLSRAKLERANLAGVDLTDARLEMARLSEADLRMAKLEGANFSRADLSRANMQGLKLVDANFARTSFQGANLTMCDLEGMHLPNANFADAILRGALLTGSHMPNANFRGANLRAAGLAEIDWGGADLRGADLRQAAFHLGSSRSGLVGSTIACEGSRTGFYTDDFDEQDFKSPEEIRKANLRGADLRGAKIEGVDFYLVDLRGARLDRAHIPGLRGCGAILDTRVNDARG